MGDAARALGECFQCDHGSGHGRRSDHVDHFWIADQFPVSRADEGVQRCADHALHTCGIAIHSLRIVGRGHCGVADLGGFGRARWPGSRLPYPVGSRKRRDHFAATEEHADLHHLPSGNGLRTAHGEPGGPVVFEGPGQGIVQPTFLDQVPPGRIENIRNYALDREGGYGYYMYRIRFKAVIEPDLGGYMSTKVTVNLPDETVEAIK